MHNKRRLKSYPCAVAGTPELCRKLCTPPFLAFCIFSFTRPIPRTLFPVGIKSVLERKIESHAQRNLHLYGFVDPVDAAGTDAAVSWGATAPAAPADDDSPPPVAGAVAAAEKRWSGAAFDAPTGGW